MEKAFEKRAIPAKVVTKFEQIFFAVVPFLTLGLSFRTHFLIGRFQLRRICGDETMKLLPPEVTSIDRTSAIALYTASIEGKSVSLLAHERA